MAKKSGAESTAKMARCKVAEKENSLSPRRGGRVRRVFGNTSGGIGRMVSRITESMTGKILSPGERTQVRADVNNTNPESFFKRSHKVIVALTVKEILDEHIAKKLV
jgi:hypothetical protein